MRSRPGSPKVQLLRSVRRVLLALSANEAPETALWRAYSLSVLLDAELHVVRVVPPLQDAQRARSKVQRADLLGALTRMLEARRATRVWLTASLGHVLPKGRIKLRGGAFFEQVAKRAAELEAALIAVSPDAAREGTRITRLARAARAPVLVARKATSQEGVVAATDLSACSATVLQSAAALCQRLNAPLVALHNLTPISSSVGPEAPIQVTLPLQPRVEQLRRRALTEATALLPAGAEAVLTSELDVAQAILEEARTRDADLIVVGTRRRNWLERLVRSGVSAKVVSEARRSVLVTPLACERDRAHGQRGSPRARSFFTRGSGAARPRGAGASGRDHSRNEDFGARSQVARGNALAAVRRFA